MYKRDPLQIARLLLEKISVSTPVHEVNQVFQEFNQLGDDERRNTALLILEQMSSSNGHVIALLANEQLSSVGTIDDIPRLENAIKRLPQIESLGNWQKHIGDTLQKLKNRRDEICACNLPFSRSTEPDATSFETLERKVDPNWGPTTTLLRCRLCQTRYILITEEGYHTPAYSWTKVV